MLSRKLLSALSPSPTPQDEYIDWQGHEWWVRNSFGPIGPNYWGRFRENVSILADNSLELSTYYYNGKWYAAEVDQNDASLGYGRYQLVYDMDPSTFDPNVVLGFYTYDQSDPADGKRELDVEMSQWGDPNQESNVWYSLQPVGDGPYRQSGVRLSPASPYTSEIIWQNGQVYYSTRDVNGLLLGEAYITDGVEVPGNEKVGLNLWLMYGEPPLDGQTTSVRLKSFTHTANVTKTNALAASYSADLTSGYGWRFINSSAVTGGAIHLPCIPAYSQVMSGNVIDIRNSSLFIHIASAPAVGNGSTELLFSLWFDSNNYLMILASGGGMAARVRQGGVNSQAGLGTLDLPTTSYWRISYASGVTTFDISSDGVSWGYTQTIATTIPDAALGTLKLNLQCGYYQAETSPGSAIIDQVN